MRGRILFRRAVAAIVIAFPLFAAVGPAGAAHATDCKVSIEKTGLGELQIELCGSGTEAHFIQATLLYPTVVRCNIEFRIVGTGWDGLHWQSNDQITPCSWNGTYADWNRDFLFAPNSLTCAEVGYAGKGWEPNLACLHIYP